ncbi:hypothetical protein H257_09922 [Aphanomyces astaci]|uniref:Uncharacterized protein n=1 Tax=Aphanomyces astaci TaxID=112090 RepID=W4GA64_APHAT|nr:hypothetical protein H257_09922 [Aphanomyces astaci]ETV75964.1 hypothetical protein H257_09922 [Aphanomyces astaci]|eukprot:XP_009834606.1 hypothetical protein H257_09922 [Aphanomyces astaci]
MTMHVHVCGSAVDAEFQQVKAVLEGLSAVHDNMHVHVTEGNSSLQIQVTTAPPGPTSTVTSLQDLLPLLRTHVSFVTPSTSPPPLFPSAGTPNGALRLFIGGDRSQVGKSTVCLGILGALLQLGYHPSELAYIKPATQCEEPQLVARFCEHYGIAAQPIGPVVFYAGFTRAFLDQPDPARASLDLLRQVVHAVDAISVGKRIVIIDGVGYPAVGSICGVSNADIAAALQPISVLLVGKKGVGDAVDSFNLNATYFSSRHVRVLGGIFNRLPAHGYYSLDQCKAAVTTYFAKMSNLDGYKAYGFVPELDPTTSAISPPDEWHAIVHAMMQHVDVRGIVADASAQATRKRRRFGKLHDDQYDDVTMHIAEPIELDTFKKPRNELTIQWKAAAQAAARHMGAPSSA